MPNFNDFYGGDYLCAADVPEPVKAKITSAKAERIGEEQKKKLALGLDSFEKRLALNATNARTMGAYLGPDYTKWIGFEVVLYSTEVDFGGKMVPAIRCRKPKDFKPSNREERDDTEIEDEVPF